MRISERQEHLLKKFRKLVKEIKMGYYPPDMTDIVIYQILELLEERPENEPLDPAWLDIWEEFKTYARGRISPRRLEAIERRIKKSIKPPIDKEVWDIEIHEDTKVTFLLGAGASAPSGIPTVDKLLPELWKRAKKIGRDDLDKLADWCNRRGINNIEDLLTAAYISNFIVRNPNVILLLDYFIFGGREVEEKYITDRYEGTNITSINFLQDTLQTLFGLLMNTMISASPNKTHEAIVDFIKTHKNTSIVTTNYDGCMDEALLKEGIPLKGTISGENEDNPNAVRLIKMHGSINWAYCDSCQDVKEFDLLELKRIYKEDKLSYPVIGICKKCGGLRRPLLIPPLSFKFLMFPHLIDIWNSARQSIEEAEYLIVVGYSFSEADAYIAKIISRSMSMNRSQKMIIVNTNCKLAHTLRERFAAHIDRFDKKRIIMACDGCDKILPEILNSMLSKEEQCKKMK